MSTIPTISLKTIPFQFSTYTPTPYQYVPEDLSILERSLAQREARMEKAYNQLAGVSAALGEYENKLNPAEAEWFNKYKTNIINQIDESINAGDFGDAIRTSISLAGKTAKDSALLSRIEANTKYNERVNRLQARADKHEISQDALKYALAINPYGFTETLDSNGNVVGGKLNDETPIYDTINWGDVAAKAAAFFRPDVIQENRGGGGSNPGIYNTKDEALKLLNGALGKSSGSWQKNWQKEEVTSKQIFDTIGKLLNMPDLLAQAIQDYDVNKWKYSNNVDLIDTDRKSLIEQGLVKNGSIIPLSEYIDNKSKLLIDALAYNKYSDTYITQNNFDITGTNIPNNHSNHNDGEGIPEQGGLETVKAPGVGVRITGIENISNEAIAAGDALNSQIVNTNPRANYTYSRAFNVEEFAEQFRPKIGFNL